MTMRQQPHDNSRNNKWWSGADELDCFALTTVDGIDLCFFIIVIIAIIIVIIVMNSFQCGECVSATQAGMSATGRRWAAPEKC